jgi:hypothetical protein
MFYFLANSSILIILSAIYYLDICYPSTSIRYRNENKCGEVYKPVRYPAFCNIFAVFNATDPLPFVPVIWIARN